MESGNTGVNGPEAADRGNATGLHTAAMLWQL